MIAVCIRIHEASRWDAARASYERQTHKDRCLVVVANGCEVDTKGIKGKVLVKRHDKPLGYGGAANACLDSAREIGADQFCLFDAGDEYGPGYVAQVVAALGPHDDRDRWDACGQGGFRLKSVRGILNQRLKRCNRRAQWGMTGGTLGGWLDTALPFDATLAHSEDRDLVLRALKAGLSVWSMGPDQYLKIPTAPSAAEVKK